MLAALQGEGLEDIQPTKGEGEGTLEESGWAASLY